MQYEIVKLEEKIIAGLAETTGNNAPDMGAKIGGLWQRFYSGTYQAIPGKVNAKAVCLYSGYRNAGADASALEYDVLVGTQVAEGTGLESSLCVKKIPAGNYAKFVVKGDMVIAVGNAWKEIWSTPLERTFTGDFEEYQEDCDCNSGTICIYVAVK